MAEFSKAIGVSPGNVGDWESEKRCSIPSAAALVQIAKTYQVSLDWLLLGESTSRCTCGDSMSVPDWEKNSQSESGLFREEDQLLLKKAAEALSNEDLRLLVLFARRLLPPAGESDSSTSLNEVTAQHKRKAPP